MRCNNCDDLLHFSFTLKISVFSQAYVGLFEKWSTLDPKHFYAIPFQKSVFLVSLYPDFLEKKQGNKKKVDFWSIVAVLVSPSRLI